MMKNLVHYSTPNQLLLIQIQSFEKQIAKNRFNANLQAKKIHLFTPITLLPIPGDVDSLLPTPGSGPHRIPHTGGRSTA